MPNHDQKIAGLLELVNFHHQRASSALLELTKLVGVQTAPNLEKQPKKRHISTAGRRAMKAAQQKRWAAKRAEGAAPTPITKMVKKAAKKTSRSAKKA
jgi:hypothetical protein